MKKALFVAFALTSFSVFASEPCDTTTEGVLKVGMQTKFYLDYLNPNAFKHNISKGEVVVDESMVGDLNRGENPSFSWTPEFSSMNYELPPNQSMKLLIANSDYQVHDYPINSSEKLVVKYILFIQALGDSGKWSTPVKHISCKKYSIEK